MPPIIPPVEREAQYAAAKRLKHDQRKNERALHMHQNMNSFFHHIVKPFKTLTHKLHDHREYPQYCKP